MRDIEFRGWSKRVDRWIHGFLIGDNKIREFGIKDTAWDVLHIGQFTGRKDRDGVKIFEGDLVYLCNQNHDEEDGALEVIFEDGQYALEGDELYVPLAETYDWEMQVAGNIFENPELKGGVVWKD